MFYIEIPWFYQDYKIENLWVFFKSVLNTGPVTRDHVKSYRIQNLYNSNDFSFMLEQVYISIFLKTNSPLFLICATWL